MLFGTLDIEPSNSSMPGECSTTTLPMSDKWKLPSLVQQDKSQNKLMFNPGPKLCVTIIPGQVNTVSSLFPSH